MNAQLQITRGPHVIGFARGARITMDGADVANVGVGKTVTLEVPPGEHVLTAWLGSNPSAQNTIDFVPGETVQLECRISGLPFGDLRLMKMGAFANTFELTSKDGRLVTGEPVMAGHHGTLILIFGILGFFFGIFGLAALIQGIVDLTKNVSRQDRSFRRIVNLVRADSWNHWLSY